MGKEKKMIEDLKYIYNDNKKAIKKLYDEIIDLGILITDLQHIQTETTPTAEETKSCKAYISSAEAIIANNKVMMKDLEEQQERNESIRRLIVKFYNASNNVKMG